VEEHKLSSTDTKTAGKIQTVSCRRCILEKNYDRVYILWYIDPLLGNDREIIQRSVNINRETVFPVLSVPRCYK
jgi:hypothetical protein